MVLKNRATTTSQCVAMHHATSNALIAGLAVMDRYPIYFSHKLLDLLVFTLDPNPHKYELTRGFHSLKVCDRFTVIPICLLTLLDKHYSSWQIRYTLSIPVSSSFLPCRSAR